MKKLLPIIALSMGLLFVPITSNAQSSNATLAETMEWIQTYVERYGNIICDTSEACVLDAYKKVKFDYDEDGNCTYSYVAKHKEDKEVKHIQYVTYTFNLSDIVEVSNSKANGNFIWWNDCCKDKHFYTIHFKTFLQREVIKENTITKIYYYDKDEEEFYLAETSVDEIGHASMFLYLTEQGVSARMVRAFKHGVNLFGGMKKEKF